VHGWQCRLHRRDPGLDVVFGQLCAFRREFQQSQPIADQFLVPIVIDPNRTDNSAYPKRPHGLAIELY